MLNFSPRIIIAALKGGSGKTILSLGLVAIWKEKGYKVAPFKKGPDLSMRAGCHLPPIEIAITWIPL